MFFFSQYGVMKTFTTDYTLPSSWTIIMSVIILRTCRVECYLSCETSPEVHSTRSRFCSLKPQHYCWSQLVMGWPASRLFLPKSKWQTRSISLAQYWQRLPCSNIQDPSSQYGQPTDQNCSTVFAIDISFKIELSMTQSRLPAPPQHE